MPPLPEDVALQMTEYKIILDQVRRRKEAFIHRLASNLVTLPGPLATPCRVWVRATHMNGYASVSIRLPGKRVRGENANHVKLLVHRLFLIMKLRRPIAEGMEAGHLCGNRICVAHVQEQTRNENLKERDGRQKAKNGGHPG